jgi:hypothetical protein
MMALISLRSIGGFWAVFFVFTRFFEAVGCRGKNQLKKAKIGFLADFLAKKRGFLAIFCAF